ncbi:hypothetical protein NM208_g14590 [Fusarium decemcellulare]|uniref:Uncharacterized protein n=1 Tax=Fusarium decemcellulare TaxID=57161 RepID=A0ACC1RG34_9HYPO|nr:hypothetical protein NM208_g14590 [Fusarium decemcellulare]
MSSQGRKIAIVGGSGTIGSPTVAALLQKNIHTITAISRTDSTATFPDNVTVLKGDYSNENFLISSLKGQDVLILQLGPKVMKVQEPLIRAAAVAGVPYILPTDWIAVVNNPLLDWSMKVGCWGIDVKSRKAEIWDSGNVKASTSTLKRVGDAVAELLSWPDEELTKYKNKPFYISSFCISQREMLESVQRATGTTDADWEIKHKDIAELTRECDERLKKGEWMAAIPKLYSSMFREGLGGNYSHKVVDMERLGFVQEDLDEVIKGVVESIGGPPRA